MKTAIIVLLVLSKGDAQDAAMVAMTRAAERALGADSRIFVHEPLGPLSDQEAVNLGEQVRASAIVEVHWSGPDRTLAHLHVHVARGEGWFDRDLTFPPTAPFTERGRTLGLQIATMVPDAPPAEPPAIVLPVPLPPEQPTPAPAIPVPQQGARRVWTLELAAVGSAGGSAQGLGGVVDVRFALQPPFTVRAALGARFGELDSVPASTRTPFGALGVFWSGLPETSAWTLGLRADLLILRPTLSRVDTNSAAIVSAARTLPGADGLVELGIAASGAIRIVAALGAEYAFGTSEVYVGDARVATIARLRGVGELGVRLAF